MFHSRVHTYASPVNCLEDYDLLENLLRCITDDFEAPELTARLFQELGTLSNILGASLERLAQVPGFDLFKANRLKTLIASAVTLSYRRVDRRNVFSSREALVDYLRIRFESINRASSLALYVDEENRLLRSEFLSVGTVGYVTSYIRQIVHRAIDLNASAAIFASNLRPVNTETAPSQTDTFVAELKRALSVFDIELIDHLLVEPDGYESLTSSQFGDVTGKGI